MHECYSCHHSAKNKCSNVNVRSGLTVITASGPLRAPTTLFAKSKLCKLPQLIRREFTHGALADLLAIKVPALVQAARQMEACVSGSFLKSGFTWRKSRRYHDCVCVQVVQSS